MNDTERMRLDEALVAAGLAPSRSRARDMVLRGTVTVGGELEKRPARRVAADARLAVGDPGAALRVAGGAEADRRAGCLRLRSRGSDGARPRRLDRRFCASAAGARRGARDCGRRGAWAARPDARRRPACHAARRTECAGAFRAASRRQPDRRPDCRSQLHLPETRLAAGARACRAGRVGRVPGQAAIRGRPRKSRQGRHRARHGAGAGSGRDHRRLARNARLARRGPASPRPSPAATATRNSCSGHGRG